MITKDEMLALNLRPLRLDNTSFGRDGVYAFVVPYTDTADEFYKVELKQDPQPPDLKQGEMWQICFTKADLEYALSKLTYYDTLSKTRQGTVKE